MDKELEEAQKLTRDDLLAKLERGNPADLARQATEFGSGFSLTAGFSQVTVEDVHFSDNMIAVGDSSLVSVRG